MTKEDKILEILNEHSKRLDNHDDQFSQIKKILAEMHQAIMVIEDDTHNKIPALFDAHYANKDHLDRNDKAIEELKEKSENHSIRIISLEIDSKQHSKQLEHLSATN